MTHFKTIFLTAFEPFGGSHINASLQVATRLAARNPEITLVELPVVIIEAERVALEAFRNLPTTPSYFIALGEAGPEPVIRLEKVAINWDDFRVPDNAGNQVDNTKIRTGGPDAYFSTIDAEQIATDLAEKTPIPVKVSLSAGAFLCNHLAYQMLDAHLACPFLFIHVPSFRPETHDAKVLEEIEETLVQVLKLCHSTLTFERS
jgi:pyroglutamyl-peptidase